MGQERCEHVSEIAGYPRRGRVCCWRPVYKDSNRCIWHADLEHKSIRELEIDKPLPGERLDGANFRGLSLYGVSFFSDCVLVGADFTNTDIRNTDFSGADLRKSSLADSTANNASFAGANMEDTIITDTDLRGADLTDARLDQATLSSSRIDQDTTFGDEVIYESDLRETDHAAERRDLLEAATRTYRTLEDLAQENTFYGQASGYYRKSKDIRRQYNWTSENYVSAFLAELSRWFTGYGNRPLRVIYTSLGVILLWGFLYPAVGALRHTNQSVVYTLTTGGSLSLEYIIHVIIKSVFFSAVTFTTLGYGNIYPVGTSGEYLASIEALLGSVLMALLVGVLTRSTWLR